MSGYTPERLEYVCSVFRWLPAANGFVYPLFCGGNVFGGRRQSVMMLCK